MHEMFILQCSQIRIIRVCSVLQSASMRRAIPDEDAIPVWIASVPDLFRIRTQGVSRKPQAEGLLEDKMGSHVYMSQSAMTQDLKGFLTAKHVPEEHIHYEGAAVHCVALVKPQLKPCSLDLLPVVQDMQRDWFSRLTGGACNEGHMYFLEVVDVLRMDVPKTLPRMQGTRTFIHDLPDWFQLEMLADITGKVAFQRSWLHETKVCIRTAKGFAALLAHGGLRSLGLCDLGAFRGKDIPEKLWSIGWDTRKILNRIPEIAVLRDNFPDNMFIGVDQNVVFQHKAMPLQSKRKLLRASQSIAGELAKLMGKHQQAASRQQMDMLMEFHDMVSSLQVHCDEMEHHIASSAASVCSKYPALMLLRCFMLCQTLKTDRELRSVCQQAVAIVCPHAQAAPLIEQVLANQSLPSATTMSRMRGRVDATWMTIFRSQMAQMFASGGVAMYITWDASPQGGRDYQMAVLDVAPVSALAKIQCTIQKLERRHHILVS